MRYIFGNFLRDQRFSHFPHNHETTNRKETIELYSYYGIQMVEVSEHFIILLPNQYHHTRCTVKWTLFYPIGSQNISRVRHSHNDVHLCTSIPERRSLLEETDIQRIGKVSDQLVDKCALCQQLREHGRIGKLNRKRSI